MKHGFGDLIAEICHKHFDSLPKNGKPAAGKEWTVMAAIVQHDNQGGVLTPLFPKIPSIVLTPFYIISKDSPYRIFELINKSAIFIKFSLFPSCSPLKIKQLMSSIYSEVFT